MKKSKRKKLEQHDRGPVREVVDQSPHLQVGEIHQEGKTTYPVAWESPHERKLIYLFLMCDDVVKIETQAKEWVYRIDGDEKERRCYPDARLVTTTEQLYLEVKSLRYFVKPKTLEKYLAIARSFIDTDHRFAILTDDQINFRWYDNAFLLARYRSRPVTPEIERAILDACKNGEVVIADLLIQAAGLVALADVYALLTRRTLAFDWDKSLTREASVSLPKQPFAGMTYERISSSGRFADLLAEVALGRRPSDQRLLAAKRARRRPLSPSSASGFVGVLTAGELGGLKREMSKRSTFEANRGASPTGEDTRTNVTGAKGG